MQLQHISMLCAILIALLSFGLISGWQLHIATLMIVVLIVALAMAFSVYVLLSYKRLKEDQEDQGISRKQLELGYESLQRLYQQSSLLREMITLLQSSKTLEDACKI